ncbi:serine/threonine protein phosphatase [Planctomycetaceae bacterium SCGC AG-212-F19]|nr:serine/threonine protein phosphatase [Planctomycetaceae bacterium SCGC AG-212-F19]
MRILAIGDIHGCLTALDRLLAEVRPERDDLIITLGDYVDRGPDSKGVIDRLLELRQACNLIALRGNHDFMMVEAWKRYQERQYLRDQPAGWFPGEEEMLSTEERDWLMMGGRQTLASYAPADRSGKLTDVPAVHWDFLENICLDCCETDRHFYVHANVYPDMPLTEQPTYMLHWEKLFDAPPHCSGKTMICGHTAQRSGKPVNLGCAICLDTWVYGAGWLTCLDVNSGRIWQANQNGDARTDHLDNIPPEK